MSDLITVMTTSDDGRTDDDKMPSYRDPGRILAWIAPYRTRETYRYDVEVLADEGCAFWIQEGEGFEYWIDQHIDLELEGFYVIEGIVGCYHRGDGWTTDDDVDWDFENVRRASPQEIKEEYFLTEVMS